MEKIRQTGLKFIIFTFEFATVYCSLGYVYSQGIISHALFFLSISFAGLIFSVYYGVMGAISAVCGSCLLFYIVIDEGILSFLSLHYIEASFFLAGLLITGSVKSAFEKRLIGETLSNEVLNQRLERLTVQLSEKDRALQDAFNEVLTDMDNPRIMYHSLRRLENVDDKDELLKEVLSLLYSHCHVEKSSVYEPSIAKKWKRIASFGSSNLPDVLDWKAEDMPEILRVIQAEREVIVPKRYDNRLLLAVPIMSISGDLLYVVLIEEIRFINLNENLINLLKVASFWIKYLIEDRLYREKLLSLSIYKTVIVYKPEISKALLDKDIDRCKNFNLPYALIRARTMITEENCRILSSGLRIYDELFLVNDNELIILLSMVTEKSVPFVLKRLNNAIPDMVMERI